MLNAFDFEAWEPLAEAAAAIVGPINALRDEKLLTVAAGDNVVRFLPPLVVTETELDEAVARLERACATLSAATKLEAAR